MSRSVPVTMSWLPLSESRIPDESSMGRVNEEEDEDKEEEEEEDL